MDTEIPCRDTDPVDNAEMAVKGETLAFTIDFGGGSDNSSEKAKKFERFAQRSSLRRVLSPRQGKSNNEENGTKEGKSEPSKVTEGAHAAKVFIREKSNIGRVTTENVTKKNVQGMMEKLNIQDIESDKVDDNDEAKSTTGTYTMDEDEDLETVSN